MGRESKAGSQQVSKLSLASHTKLKFRSAAQKADDARDLRAELAAAERAAQDKKRKAAGLPPLPVNEVSAAAARLEEGEEAVKRRKVLEEAAELDKDDSDEEEDDGDEDEDEDDRCVLGGLADDSESDDEDDTAALMAELARIKQERAEEKARLVSGVGWALR